LHPPGRFCKAGARCPVTPVSVAAAVSARAPLTGRDGITVTAVWDRGDGTTSAGVVSQTGSSGTLNGSHTYATAGVCTPTLTVTDQDGGRGQSVAQYVVVYEPRGWAQTNTCL
jgi:PKD repeat protein